jgi:hypothetical protein
MLGITARPAPRPYLTSTLDMMPSRGSRGVPSAFRSPLISQREVLSAISGVKNLTCVDPPERGQGENDDLETLPVAAAVQADDLAVAGGVEVAGGDEDVFTL